MPNLKRIKRKIVDKTSDILSAPSRMRSKFRGDRAKRQTMQVKLASQTRHIKADPSTKFGREILSARLTKAELKKKGIK